VKIGDLVKRKIECDYHGTTTTPDIGLILRTYKAPEPIVWIIWQRDGFEQGYTVAIAERRLEVLNDAQA